MLPLSVALAFDPQNASAQSHDENKAAARALATQGAAALKGANFAEALDLVSRAEALLHAPTHVLMIARAQVGIGRFVAAQESYLKLVHEDLPSNAPAAFKNAQQAARQELPAVEPRIASLRIVLEGAKPEQVTVKLDDQGVSPALIGVFRPVDPGKHEVVVHATGIAPVRGSIQLGDGDKKEIKLLIPEAGATAFAPLQGPSGGASAGRLLSPGSGTPAHGSFVSTSRVVGLGAGVVGIAGVAMGVAFLVKGANSQRAANDLATRFCRVDASGVDQCPASVQNQIHPLDVDAANQKNVGTVALAVGGVALAGGIVLLLVGKPSAPAAPAVAITPWCSITPGGVHGRF